MADRNCPWCNRRAPALVCVAVVFGTKYLACGRRECQVSSRALAEVMRESHRAEAHGCRSVDVLESSRGFTKGVLIIHDTKLGKYSDHFSQAVMKVLDPWFQTDADRDALLVAADFLSELAKQKAPELPAAPGEGAE